MAPGLIKKIEENTGVKILLEPDVLIIYFIIHLLFCIK